MSSVLDHEPWAIAGRHPGLAEADASIEFGRFRILLLRRQLFADGIPVELGARAFDILMVLIEANGSLLTKRELMARVWPNVVVEEGNLKSQISTLRKALGRDGHLIRTEIGRGYRFIGAVPRTSAPSDTSSTRHAAPGLEPGAATALAKVALRLAQLEVQLAKTLGVLATLVRKPGSSVRRPSGPGKRFSRALH
jgi:DNA-binding winged helix-turn-helix (wHTH) protein